MRYSSLLLVSTLLLPGVLHAKQLEKVSTEWAEKWLEETDASLFARSE